MTDVTEDRDQAGAELSAADEQVLRELTERARAGGLKLTGEGGLLGRLTKMIIRRASWMIISATASTTPQAATAAIPVTATGRRR